MMYVYNKVHVYPSVQVEGIGNFRELFFSLHHVGSGSSLFLLGYISQASSPMNFRHISCLTVQALGLQIHVTTSGHFTQVLGMTDIQDISVALQELLLLNHAADPVSWFSYGVIYFLPKKMFIVCISRDHLVPVHLNTFLLYPNFNGQFLGYRILH